MVAGVAASLMLPVLLMVTSRGTNANSKHAHKQTDAMNIMSDGEARLLSSSEQWPSAGLVIPPAMDHDLWSEQKHTQTSAVGADHPVGTQSTPTHTSSGDEDSDGKVDPMFKVGTTQSHSSVAVDQADDAANQQLKAQKEQRERRKREARRRERERHEREEQRAASSQEDESDSEDDEGSTEGDASSPPVPVPVPDSASHRLLPGRNFTEFQQTCCELASEFCNDAGDGISATLAVHEFVDICCSTIPDWCNAWTNTTLSLLDKENAIAASRESMIRRERQQ